MAREFDPESIDLAELTRMLRERCGSSVEGSLVGRTRLRDEVVRELGCSELEGEELVDTMIGRRFIVKQRLVENAVEWLIAER